MDRHKSAFRTKLLTIVWLFTAAIALILSAVYFDKLQRLYAEIDVQAQAAGANRAEKETRKNAEGSGASKKKTDPVKTDAENTDTKKTADAAKQDLSKADGLSESSDPEGSNVSDSSAFDDSYGIDPKKPIIALSFDDGPSVYTERIVSALEKNHASATFFMVGYNVENHKNMVRLVYDSGFEIGNHTGNHKRLTDLNSRDIKAEVFDNEDLINTIVPVGEIIVRPPYGSFNDTVGRTVDRPMFNWSVDSQDWKTKDADSIVKQIRQDAKDGYIILMHDLYESTAEAAERIIPWLIDQGYQVTDISTMFKARGITPEKGELYRYAPGAQ